MPALHFQFEWNETKASVNLRKHKVSFEIAATVFQDPRLPTVADIVHGEAEERWFSIGLARNGVLLSIAHLWDASHYPFLKIRLISARRSTASEICWCKDRE
ncbi:MAG: BrnT family toxin [Acidobacteria bacterium]|nr:BrnT family toxin [Acidobacteriota bacterium]